MPDTRPRPVLCGEVLFDRFPDGRAVLGGAPFNVAWHLAAFGLDPLLISRVGADRAGARIRAAMHERGMDTRGLQTDPDWPTGEVRVRLEEGEPQFDILAERAWDRLDPNALPPLPEAGLVYTGTLIRRSPASAATVDRLLQGPLPLFLDVNLRTPWWSTAATTALMARARWLKLNEDELRRLHPDECPLAERAEALHQSTGAEQVIITRGERGAVLHAPGQRPLRTVPEPATPVIDTVGAGDAFASVLIAGLLLDWPTGTTLHRAGRFATAVVGLRGAVSEDPAFYRPFRKNWFPNS